MHKEEMNMADNGLNICVLFRFSKKTGVIDTTMTGMGSALMQMWALQNTTTSKRTLIFDRETGKCLFAASGTKDGFPKVKKNLDVDCEYFGIKLEDLQSITDDRFDN